MTPRSLPTFLDPWSLVREPRSGSDPFNRSRRARARLRTSAEAFPDVAARKPEHPTKMAWPVRQSPVPYGQRSSSADGVPLKPPRCSLIEEPCAEELMEVPSVLFCHRSAPLTPPRSPNKVNPVFSNPRGGPPAWYGAGEPIQQRVELRLFRNRRPLVRFRELMAGVHGGIDEIWRPGEFRALLRHRRGHAVLTYVAVCSGPATPPFLVMHRNSPRPYAGVSAPKVAIPSCGPAGHACRP